MFGNLVPIQSIASLISIMLYNTNTMSSLAKTLVLISLLINIVCVTNAPRVSIFGRQLSLSKSKEVKRAKEDVKKEEEDEALVDCKRLLYTPFSMLRPMDNFLYAFLYINEEDFIGHAAHAPITKSYYEDMLFIAMDNNLPPLLSPLEYCVREHEEESTLQLCLDDIKEAGCDVVKNGIVCLGELYHHWKKPEQLYPGAVRGTENITDEELNCAIRKGSGRIDNYPDDGLLEDFYSENGSRCISDEESSSGGSYERQIMEYKQRQNDLYEARVARYGIGEVSYADLIKEFYRRKTLTKQFADNYAMYIYKILKHCADDRFLSREQYCLNYLKKLKEQTNPV